MDARDLELRNLTYRFIVEVGRAPSAVELARRARVGQPTVAAAWQRLHDAHALVLDDAGGIRMLNPFSAVPTTFRVAVGDRSWYANCGWDAFGIGASLGADSAIDTQCADCHEALRIKVRDQQPDRDDLIWHVLVPAREWWHDIGYT